MDAQSNRGEEMNKLETLAEKLDTAIRFALIGSGLGNDVSIGVHIHNARVADGIQWTRRESDGVEIGPYAIGNYGTWPQNLQLNLFASIPDTQLATDDDQPF
jgi:hypothetical protein